MIWNEMKKVLIYIKNILCSLKLMHRYPHILSELRQTFKHTFMQSYIVKKSIMQKMMIFFPYMYYSLAYSIFKYTRPVGASGLTKELKHSYLYNNIQSGLKNQSFLYLLHANMQIYFVAVCSSKFLLLLSSILFQFLLLKICHNPVIQI